MPKLSGPVATICWILGGRGGVGDRAVATGRETSGDAAGDYRSAATGAGRADWKASRNQRDGAINIDALGYSQPHVHEP